jgi:5-methyltetrahydrofolate--homocysteine methyltransferase
VVGLFPAQASGDDVQLFRDPDHTQPLSTLYFLRQQTRKPEGRPNRCLADFVAPAGTVHDFLGLFAVTAGLGMLELVAAFEADHDDFNAILAKALGDRLAEAFAEKLHRDVRRHLWEYAPDEALSNQDLIAEKYRGIRPAPGYPACPDHTEKRTLFEILDVSQRVGIELTEGLAMFPAASVSGYYFGHPNSAYFGVGKIDRDQVRDYARRKGQSVNETERWLAPILGYEPAG